MTTSMTNERISVVFPNYNHGRFLEGMLSALLTQSVRPYEIIVTDDGSTDDSLTILRRLEQEHPEITVLVHEKNQGAVAAVNLAMSHATGEFIFATAADDTIQPGFFEESLALLNKHPEAGMSYAGRRSVTEEGILVQPNPRSSWTPANEPVYIDPEHVVRILNNRGLFILDSTNFYRVDALEEFVPWSPELGPFITSFAAHTIALQRGVCYTPNVLTERRVSSTQYSVEAMRDIDGALVRTDAAINMMENDYGHLWPRKFVMNYRRSEARRIAHLLITDSTVRQAETLGRINALIGYRPSLLARFSLLMLRGALALNNKLDAVFLKWRFRPTFGAMIDRIRWKLGRG